MGSDKGKKGRGKGMGDGKELRLERAGDEEEVQGDEKIKKSLGSPDFQT
jgi:hypothetical protein